MEDMTIQLNINESLDYDSNGKLCVRKSLKTGNTLTFEEDGLYAQAIPGEPGPTGTGYPDGYRSANGISSGIEGPESSQAVSMRMVGPNIMHRIFTCENVDGSDIELRSVDRMYPGDMYRVRDTEHSVWNYYMIISVNATGTGVANHSVIVASIPFTAEDVN